MQRDRLRHPRVSRIPHIRETNGNPISWSVRILLALILIAMGACVAFVLLPEPTPAELNRSDDARSAVRASSESFDDSRDVKITVVPGSSQSVTSPISGVITSFSCSAGATIASGTSFMSVNGTSLLALSTDTPPYRTLISGMTGNDVRSLNDALRALGYAAPSDNRMTWSTITAFNRAARQVGARQIDAAGGWAITPDSFVWLDAGSAAISSCQSAKGTTIAAGTAVMTVRTQPKQVTLAVPSGMTVTGDRVLAINGQTYELPAADGSKTIVLKDPSIIAAIVGSDAYRAASSASSESAGSGASDASGDSGDSDSGGGATVSGGQAPAASTSGASGSEVSVSVTLTSRLKHPVIVWDVLPSSIYDLNGNDGCVVSDGKARHVMVVASELGKTKVMVAGGARLGAVLTDPKGDRTC